MERSGDWLTPTFLGRLFLFKPPLLLWTTAASIRLLGVSVFALRMPAVLFGAAGIAAVFAWCWWMRSLSMGVVAALVLVSSELWRTFSRLCYTDMPCVTCITLAMAAASFDPLFERRRTRVLFGLFGGAAILAKSVAGLIPFAAMVLYFVFTRRRPSWRALFEVSCIATTVVMPWIVYQSMVHPHWFYADFIQVQLLGVGLQRSPRSFPGAQVIYYLKCLARLDPSVLLLGIAGLWSRKNALLPAAWVLITLLVLFAFQAQNLPYVVFLLPALCVFGALRAPTWLGAVAAVAALAMFPFQSAAPPIPGAAAMQTYQRMHRPNELILANTDDQFVSATIGLPHVRYCFVDTAGHVAAMVPHYVPLGITMSLDTFLTAPRQPYADRLREWGVASAEPIGTAIILQEPADLEFLLVARPSSDFYLPAAWLAMLSDAASRKLVPLDSGYVFLLSRQ